MTEELFTCVKAISGSSFSNETTTTWIVYPKKYEGEGGGSLMAEMDRQVVLHFNDEASAKDACDKLNRPASGEDMAEDGPPKRVSRQVRRAAERRAAKK